MINTVPGFTERSAAQNEFETPVLNGGDLENEMRGGLFAKERIERFDLGGGSIFESFRTPKGVEIRESAEAPFGRICRLCRGFDPARIRVRIRPGGGVRQ